MSVATSHGHFFVWLATSTCLLTAYVGLELYQL